MIPVESFAGECVAGPYYIARKPDEVWVSTARGESQKRIVESPAEMSTDTVLYDIRDVHHADRGPGRADQGCQGTGVHDEGEGGKDAD